MFDKSKYSAQWLKMSEIDGEDKTFMFRKDIDARDLVASIKEHGQREPILLRKLRTGKYQIVCGHRRYQALKELNFESALVIIVPEEEMSDQDALEENFIENRDRKSFRKVDNIAGVQKLKNMGFTNDKIAKHLGISEAMVRKYLKVIEIGAQQQVKNGGMSISEAQRQADKAGGAQKKPFKCVNTKSGFSMSVKYNRNRDDVKEVVAFLRQKADELEKSAAEKASQPEAGVANQ